MTDSISFDCRRFEHGLQHFGDIDIKVFIDMEARSQKIQKELRAAVAQAEAEGVPFEEGPFTQRLADVMADMPGALAKAGKLKSLRKLAAIWRATDEELRLSETDPRVMARLEEAVARGSFHSAYKDALAFHSELLASLGGSPGSSANQTAAPEESGKSEESDKAGSPSGEK